MGLLFSVVVAGTIVGIFFAARPTEPIVATFEECVEAGFPVLESYPRRCMASSGETFTEDVGNELEKTDLIQVTNPRPNQVISSPLLVTGKARGNWYFEASFPIKLLDANGKELAITPAEAQSEWMTTDFVPFRVELKFDTPATAVGILVLEKDNPSGLPEHADELRIPIRFK